MSTIASLGVKEEIKNILESGRLAIFAKKISSETLRNFKKKCSQILPSQRPSTLFIEMVKQSCSGECHKESK